MTPPLLKRYLIALDKHKILGLGSFFVVVGISGVVAMQPPPPPTYQTTGVLAYNPPVASFTATGPQIQEQGKQLSEAFLLNEKVVTEVAAQVNVSPRQIRQKVKIKLPIVSSKKDKDKDAGPPRIEVTYVDDNPKRAYFTLQALMQAMVEESRNLNTLRLQAIIKSISERLPKVKQELQASEQKLERYIRVEGPAIVAAQDGTIVGGITGAQQQQRQLILTLGGIETQINSLQSRLGLNPDEAYTSSALSADPIIAKLRSQIQEIETQLKIFSRDLRPEHPKMIELNQQQQAYEKLLQERAAEVMGGKGKLTPLPAKIRSDSSLDPSRQQLANTLVALQTQRETLLQQLNATRQTEQELRQEYVKIPNKQLEQRRLQQEVLLHQDFYDKMLKALTDAKAAEAETVSSLAIAQLLPPSIDAPPRPNVLLTVGAGVFVGLLVGGGLIFWLASLDVTCYTPEEVRAVLRDRDVPVLGEVPFVTVVESEVEEKTAVLLDSDSPYLEFYEKLRSNLPRASNKSNTPIKVLLLTSTEAGEGKTMIAFNLGIAAARAGKRTLLVEADLRSPTSANSLKVAPHPEASLEPLRYYDHMSDCIQLVPDVENLYIVPSPGPVLHAAAVLESSEFRHLLKDARGRFDFVVLDTPTLSSCNDALMLEPYTDGMLLVTRPGYTKENLLAETVEELTESELLLGAIVNGVDTMYLLQNYA